MSAFAAFLTRNSGAEALRKLLIRWGTRAVFWWISDGFHSCENCENTVYMWPAIHFIRQARADRLSCHRRWSC